MEKNATFIVNRVAPRDHVRKGLFDLMYENVSLLVTTFPSLLVIDLVEEDTKPF